MAAIPGLSSDGKGRRLLAPDILITFKLSAASKRHQKPTGGIRCACPAHFKRGIVGIATRHRLPDSQNQSTIKERQISSIKKMDASLLFRRVAQAENCESLRGIF